MLPCVVAKGFAQGMTADIMGMCSTFSSFLHNSECLRTVDWTLRCSPFCKNIIFRFRIAYFKIYDKRSFDVLV